MKITITELRRLVYEAVAQATGKKKRKGTPPEGPRGPDGYVALPAHDLSKPRPGGGRMKRQGTSHAPPVLTSEQVRNIVRKTVREALRR
ncbi:MAG: hypothetical protein WC763_07010 [Candidatus Paceibacterota bacterium]|jgi:hypothetical protein